MLRITVIIAALVVALSIISGASASANAMRPHYMGELGISNFIEAHGMRMKYGHLNVDSAFCSGLRRYGVRTSEWGMDRFWHFDCYIDTASGHSYEVKLKTVQNSRYWTWVPTSVHFEY